MKVKRFKTGFTQTPNQVLQSKYLSWKAKGIYSYMLSKPADWDFAAERMCEESDDEATSTRTGIRELINYGVLKKKKLKSGRVSYELFAKVESHQRKSQVGKTSTISNIESKEISKSSDELAIEKIAQDKNKKIVAMITMFKTWNPAAVRWYANKTQRDACSILIDNYDFKLLSVIIKVYIPLANGLEYVKGIKTPLQLLDNIATYSDNLEKQGFFETYKVEISNGIKEIEEYGKT